MADDKRESAKLLVALSSQLITAKLAMLTMTGAVAIFVLTNKTLAGAGLVGFLFLVAGVALLFVLAIAKAAGGIYKVAKSGAEANWGTQDAQPSFDTQTRITFVGLVGLLALVVVASVADSKQSDLEMRVSRLENSLQNLVSVEREIGSVKDATRALDQRLSQDVSALEALQRRIEVLENRVPSAAAKR